MPFDELKRRAFEALEPRRQAYHSAVATAVDEVRTVLEAGRPRRNGKGERLAAELGLFAAGRIDVDRVASVLGEEGVLTPDAVEGIEAAIGVLNGLLAQGDGLYTVKVPAGADLRNTVRDALSRAGAAFGAARAVECLRVGVPAPEYAGGFAPERWNRAEREIAPPLVVELEGADLRPAGLVDYLEGRQALVLLVRKAAPPAALVRLVAPGVLVAQGPTAEVLGELGGWDGPAVLAIAAEATATFTYRPERDGPGSLVVQALSDRLRPVGTLTLARQQSDLALLRMLDTVRAGGVVAAAAAPAASEEADPAAKLAAWLLRQAIIPEPGEEA
jgi:hypothetical protein